MRISQDRTKTDMGQRGSAVEFGMDQLNTFDTFTLDCWKDRVYYEG